MSQVNEMRSRRRLLFRLLGAGLAFFVIGIFGFWWWLIRNPLADAVDQIGGRYKAATELTPIETALRYLRYE